jgi:hypothetical protein
MPPKKLSKFARCFAVLPIAVLTGCTTTNIGSPTIAPIASDSYTGPALSTEKPSESTALAPGVELSIGNGERAVTCAMGWILRATTDDTTLLTTAGQCGTPGLGMPVRFRYATGTSTDPDRAQEITVADVLATSFTEPFRAGEPNIALLTWRPVGTENVPVSVFPGAQTTMEPYTPIGDAEAWAAAHREEKACWVTNAAKPTTNPLIRCGTVDVGVGNKVAVNRAENNALQPYQAGTAVFWEDAQGKYRPLGIATEDRRGRVIVDTLDGVIAKLNEQSNAGYRIFLGVAP